MYKKYFVLVMLALFPSFLCAATNAVDSDPIYTFGDYKLSDRGWGIKIGPLASDEIPDGFPVSFLQLDGSYPGGRIYAAADEAKQGLLEAQESGIIPEEGDWGVYLLEGNWGDYAYELRPNEFHLNKSTRILQRIF